MVARVLVANRAEIAARVIRACHEEGLETVVAVSSEDRHSAYARTAGRAVCIGPSRASDSYLNQDALIQTALSTGCDAVHPGYGFLSENAKFAQKCADAGLNFIGPPAATIDAMGNKLNARRIAEEASVPTMPGSGNLATYQEALTAAEKVGYPILMKAAAGGGGRGIRIVHEPDQLKENYESATAEALAAFGDGTIYLERYLARARHVEIQIFGDTHGNVLHFGERDCSLQRRYQKIVEEAPSVSVRPGVRAAMREAAVKLGKAIGYVNAGTVEFIYDADQEDFYFLEVNTRIQVEHPVTEMITGVDLVRLQLAVASGAPIPFQQEDITFDGHAIECRINAEDAAKSFRPSPGTVVEWLLPGGDGIRLDSHIDAGERVSPMYDSLIAKVIVHGRDRTDALAKMVGCLRGARVAGVATTVPFLINLLEADDVRANEFHTKWVEENIADLTPAPALSSTAR